jgi:hypothetical protein
MSDQDMKRHKHADAIIAWANGEAVEYKGPTDESWGSLLNASEAFAAPGFYSCDKYRVKPKEVVDYTVVLRDGIPGATFFHTLSRVDAYYAGFTTQGYLQRTSVDGKVVDFKFIPLDKETSND